MLDTRRHIRSHALALNRHRDAVEHVQEELGSVKRVLKDVTGRPSSDFNRLLDDNKSRCELCSQNLVPKVQGATPACRDLHSCRASRSSTIQPIPGPVRTPNEVVDTTETFKVTLQQAPVTQSGKGSRSQLTISRNARQIQRASLALGCLVFVANSTAVITNAISLCTHENCLLFAKVYGIVSGSLAIIWFCREHFQKAKIDRQEKEDQKEPICEVSPLDIV